MTDIVSAKLSRIIGKWAYIWRLENFFGGDLAKTMDYLLAAKVAGVAIKAHNGWASWDGPSLYNFVKRATDAKMEIAFWGYDYLAYNPLAEANTAAKVVLAYKDVVDIYLIDAESEAKGCYVGAKIFANRLKSQLDGAVPIALNSYRFPELHSTLPWSTLRSISDVDVPQVYYRNGDPLTNLVASMAQYAKMSPKLPYLPAGDMYHEFGITPTPAAVTRFMQSVRSKELHAAIMWASDPSETTPDLWKAFAAFDWGQGAGSAIAPVSAVLSYKARLTGNLNIRTGPGPNFPKTGSLPTGTVIDVLEAVPGWVRIAQGWLWSQQFITRI